MAGFRSLARQVRDPHHDLALRRYSLRKCLERFAPYGHRATWDHLCARHRIEPEDRAPDPARLMAALDELEEARAVWLAYEAEFAERRKREKHDGLRSPGAFDDWHRQTWGGCGVAWCGDPAVHPSRPLAEVLRRLISALRGNPRRPARCAPRKRSPGPRGPPGSRGPARSAPAAGSWCPSRSSPRSHWPAPGRTGTRNSPRRPEHPGGQGLPGGPRLPGRPDLRVVRGYGGQGLRRSGLRGRPGEQPRSDDPVADDVVRVGQHTVLQRQTAAADTVREVVAELGRADRCAGRVRSARRRRAAPSPHGWGCARRAVPRAPS